MRKHFFLALAMIFLFAGQAWAEPKIGIINFEKIVKDSEFWAESTKELEAKYKDEAERLEKMMNDIKSMADEIQKQSVVLSQEAKEDKQLDFKRKSRDFEDQRRAYMRKIKKEEDDLKKTILGIIFEVTNDYGKKNAYDFIMDSAMGGIVYASPTLDLTGEILVDVNRAWREKKKSGQTGN